MSEPSSLLLPVLDAALRGTLLALLVLLAARLLRDRPALPAAQAAVVLALGSCVQVIGSTPLFEALVPRAWQAPFIAIAVANVVLFWVFVQALFDDDFRFQPMHGAAYGVVLLVSGVNCVVWAADGPTPVARVSLGTCNVRCLSCSQRSPCWPPHATGATIWWKSAAACARSSW